jgi:hypothetical protein
MAQIPVGQKQQKAAMIAGINSWLVLADNLQSQLVLVRQSKM